MNAKISSITAMEILALLRNPFDCLAAKTVQLWNGRFGYLFAILILLQRTPVLRELIAMRPNLVPSFSNILRVSIPTGIGVGTIHSVTGATGVAPVNPSMNPASAKVGEPFTWVFRTTGEKAKSYSVTGLPPGVALSGTVQNSISSLGGTPTASGDYKITIIGWENRGQKGRKTPSYTLNLNVEGDPPPTIEEHPIGGTFAFGESTVLRVGATGNGLSYQWFKDGVSLTDENTRLATLELSALKPEDAGTYSVEVSNGTATIQSYEAEIIVQPQDDYQRWISSHWTGADATDEVVSGPSADPDGDGATNLMEYASGSDPLLASSVEMPRISTETIDKQSYVVIQFALGLNSTRAMVRVEGSGDLVSGHWTQMADGKEGVVVVETTNNLAIKVPAANSYRFFRIQVELGAEAN